MNPALATIRQICRAVMAQRTWTIAALLCLAIGTGANTAVFSVINGFLLRPLPFEDPHQIVMIAIRWDKDRQAGPVSLKQFRELRDAAGPFQQFAARTYLPLSLAFEGSARNSAAAPVLRPPASRKGR